MSELSTAHYSIRTSSSGVAISFGTEPASGDTQRQGHFEVKLSHQTAKTLAMELRRQLKRYERDGKAEIVIPPQLMEEMGLAPQDW